MMRQPRFKMAAALSVSPMWARMKLPIGLASWGNGAAAVMVDHRGRRSSAAFMSPRRWLIEEMDSVVAATREPDGPD